MTEFVWVYMTAKDRAEALAIGRTLVEKRLAACINVWDGMQSLYWWEGKIEEGHEAVLVAKARRDRLDALQKVVKAVHSYQVPCIVSLPIESGNPDYLKWLRDVSS